MKLTVATIWMLACASVPFAAAGDVLRFSDPGAPLRYDAGSLDPMPPCYTDTCWNGGSSYDTDFPETNSNCITNPLLKYFKKTKRIYTWSCPGNLYYHTCMPYSEEPLDCSVYENSPCPTGNCYPIHGGPG